MRLKKREKDESLIRRSFYQGAGVRTLFRRRESEGAAMLGRLSHFRAHADKKGGLGAPLGEKPLLKKDHVKSDRPREEGATYGHVRAKKGPPRRVHVTVRCSPLSFEKEQSSLRSLFLQGACSSSFSSSSSSSSSSFSSCSSSFLLPFSQRASLARFLLSTLSQATEGAFIHARIPRMHCVRLACMCFGRLWRQSSVFFRSGE